jgi:DNA-binding Lrp family transcriptional regulator
VVITQRDKTLLFKLSRYALMTTKQIQKSVFNGVAMTTVLRRLRILEKSGYIQRVEGLENAEKAWTVTLKGCEGTADRVPKRHFNRSTLPHDVRLTDLRLALEGHGIAHSWIAEHEIRSQMARSYGLTRMQGRNVPDGLMGVEYQGVKQSIGIELELHFKNQGRYKNIFESYRSRRSLWGIWYVVQTKSLGKHLDKVWRKLYGETQAPLFMWSLVDEVIANPLEAPIYYYDKSFQAKGFWKLNSTNNPAQEAALGMSTREDKKTENQIDANNENQKELPAKAS